jgi:hypothetical protein
MRRIRDGQSALKMRASFASFLQRFRDKSADLVDALAKRRLDSLRAQGQRFEHDFTRGGDGRGS